MKNCFHTCLTVFIVLFVLSCAEAVDDATPVDTTAPTTSVSPPGGDDYDTALSVTLSCDDGDGSGCAVTYYSTDGTDLPTTVYSGAISIGMGETTLRFYSGDIAGNSEAVQAVDYVTPTVTSVVGGGRYYDDNTALHNAYTIALKSNGTVWSWGDNGQGQLGYGNFGSGTNSSTPKQVVGNDDGSLTGVSAIAAGGRHALALNKEFGTVWAWGDNEVGQLGTITSENYGSVADPVYCSSTPVLVEDLTGVIAIAAGQHHSLALKDDETVLAWGGNSKGQLGNGQTSGGGFIPPGKVCTAYDVETTPACTPLENITAIAAGLFHSLALDRNNTVWAWGSNGPGQLGDDNQPDDSSVAVQVCAAGASKPCSTLIGNVLTNITAIAAGQFHSLALQDEGLLDDGKVLTWGWNRERQLGNGKDYSELVLSPVPVWVRDDQQNDNSLLTDVDAITAGGWHSFALKNDNTVWSWGGNSRGQLGDNNLPNDSSFAVQLCASGTIGPCTDNFFTNVDALADGVSHSGFSLVLKNGTVWGWGDNDWGQLGDGTTNDRSTPVQVVPF